MTDKTVPERWIVEVRDRHGNKISRRYFDSKEEADAAAALRKQRGEIRPGHIVRVFRAVQLSLVK